MGCLYKSIKLQPVIPVFSEGIPLTIQSGVTTSNPSLCHSISGGNQLWGKTGVAHSSPSLRQSTRCGLMLVTEDKHWILVAKLRILGGMRTIHCATARDGAF